MTTDLFEAETTALQHAQTMLAHYNAEASTYRHALAELVAHYEKLMRESKRLITRSDRTERELNTANAKLQQLTAALDYKARHDNLTGALNRGAIFDRAAQHLQQSPLALIILDIDFFKRINDEFGHPAGDAVIQELVVRLRFSLDGTGEVGRVGGEEFTVLMPDTSLENAFAIAERIRHCIADKPFPCLPNRQVTASFGVSWHPAGTRFEDAYQQVDTALYQAKHRGRNRVELVPA
jgi:diguanylate cyclase (GGDEF)-like protein